MGMLLRRHDRKPDREPKVNGKPVEKQPRKKNITQEGDRGRTPRREYEDDRNYRNYR